jgi:hypothetical protein
MAFKGAHGESQKLSCPLLVEERLHGFLPPIANGRNRALDFAEKVLPNLPLNFPASLAGLLSAGLAVPVPGLSTRLAADVLEFGSPHNWPNKFAFRPRQQSRDNLLRYGLVRWVIPRLAVHLSGDR